MIYCLDDSSATVLDILDELSVEPGIIIDRSANLIYTAHKYVEEQTLREKDE